MSHRGHRAHREYGTADQRPRISVYPLFVLCVLCASPAFAQAPTNLQPDSGRDCAVCHLEWTDSFAAPRAVTLMDKPAKPSAAESDTCLGCHDGSVADSRLEVWLEHGHKTGVAPSAAMFVPQELPLEDGKLACRTCHTAHAAGGPVTFKDLVFLRVKNDTGQLCKSCHTDKSQGPEAGTHPLGKLDWKLPDTLAAAGSHAGADNQEVVCQTCHTAHGSKTDHLLLLSTDSNQLCVTCHDKIRPGMWRDNGQHEHPQSPPLRTVAQKQAVKDMGTRLGPDGNMICLSCHKMHHGQSGRAMLADTLNQSSLCIRCHPERANMANSGHDLRKTAPAELNARGQNSTDSGPCGSCHTFHSYARQRTPSNGDPQGVCTTCHAPDKVASKHTGQPFSHPSEIEEGHIPKDMRLALYPSRLDPTKMAVACLSCHDPHDVKQQHFLRSTGDELCANCHGEKVKALAGSHDFTDKDLKNSKGRDAKQAGKCGFCHAVHDAKGPAMWAVTNSAPRTPDDLCADCHRENAIASKHPVAKFNHPTGPQVKPTTRPADTNLPLFNAQAHQTSHDGFVACSSCHDLHQSDSLSKAHLRKNNITELCLGCHPGQGALAGGLHDVRRSEKPWLGNDKKPEDLCTGCHKPHANDPARQRWAVAPLAGVKGSDAICSGCHPNSAPAPSDGKPVVGAMMHPQTVSADSESRRIPHGFPLERSERGDLPDTVACKTCHDPHANARVQHLLRTTDAAPAHAICLSCHTEPQHVVKGMHSPDLLDPEKPVRHACHPCHATHATATSEKPLLWAAKKFSSASTQSEQLCLGCHSRAGGAKVPTVVRHPETALKKLTDATTQPTELQKKLAAIDQITCSTCHLAHGRDLTTAASPTTQPARAALSAAKPMLRPDVDREICATCHGFDSTRVYLYFHNPKKRAAIKKFMGE